MGSSLVKAMENIFIEVIFMWYTAIAVHSKSSNRFTLMYMFSLQKKKNHLREVKDSILQVVKTYSRK